MKYIRLVVAVFTLAFLGGCSSAPSANQGTARSLDSRYAIWIDGAKGTVWARLQSFEPNSLMVASLLRACQSGKDVEVLVWAGAAQAVSSFKGSCLRIWITNHPDVARLPDTLLVDSDTLVIYGNLENFQGAGARNEYFAQANVKLTQAHRVN